MTSYAIGDLQGCGERLDTLLRAIHAEDSAPRLIFVGDLVNRGPQSLATLRRIRAMGNSARVVLGNHDLHLLATAHGIRRPGRLDTIDEILGAPDRDELLDWLRRQPLALLENDHLIVHAGVLPQWDELKTMALAHEVESVLRGPHWLDFLREMYGNTPSRWDDSLQGADRLRCIVNALTRLRFCTIDGTMDFSTSDAPAEAPIGHYPWFDVPGRKTQHITVVCGHWSTLGLLVRPDLIALDTGCVWGGKLSGVRLRDRAVFQVACPQYQQPG